MFRKYHYLNDILYRRHVECYIAYIQDEAVGFLAMIHFVHSRVKNIWMIHRLVVLPDFQGVGIGKHLMTSIAERYRVRGLRIRIVTSNPALLISLSVDQKWRLKDMGRKSQHGGLKSEGGSSRRFTTAWEYYPD